MTKAGETGEDTMKTIGVGVVGALQGIVVAVVVMSIGYLIGAGWMVATTQ